MLNMAGISSKRLKYVGNELDMWKMESICEKRFQYAKNYLDMRKTD